MGPWERIDREKHEADVLERVVKGVRAEEVRGAQSQLMNLGVRPWIGGHVVTAVQVQLLERTDDE